MRSLELVRERLAQRGLRPHSSAESFSAFCPAHEDLRHQSLSVSVGRDRDRVVVYCHRGCEVPDILDALNLQWRDLFEDDAPKPWSNDGLRRAGARVQPDGRVRLGAVDYNPGAKTGPKSKAAAGASRDLWPAPEGLNRTNRLYVVEGEPDAVSAMDIGLTAVGMPGTSSSKGERAKGYAQRIAAACDDIVIVADSDTPGREHAQRMAELLAPLAKTVRIVDLDPSGENGSDLSEFMSLAITDRDRDQARNVVERAADQTVPWRVPSANPPMGWHLGTPPESPVGTGDSGVPTVGTLGTDGAPRRLRVLDVERMLVTEPPPIPWVAEPLLAEGCVTMLAGREGQGKSMLALALAAAIGHGAPVAGMDPRSGSVLYVDAENGEREAHRRIRGLGVRSGALSYVTADGFDLRKHMDELAEFVEERKPTVVVLDSLRSLAPGLDENDSAQCEQALRPVTRLAQDRGLAILVLHHAGKAGVEYRGSTAIGAAVELGFALARHPDDPEGRTRRRLACWKSRPAPEPETMWLTLESVDDSISVTETDPYEPASGRREEAEQTLMAALNGHPTPWPEWARQAGMDPKNGTARRARRNLEDQGLVTFAEGLYTRQGN